MKKILFLLLINVGAFGQTVHRVTNGMNLQTVIDNAASGDVIMVEGGNYGNITLIKSLTFFGTGYFLNDDNSPTERVSRLGYVYLNQGSNYSILSGFDCQEVQLNSSNNILTKNKIGKLRIGNSFQSNFNHISKNLIFGSNFNIEIRNNSHTFHLINNIIKGGFDIGSEGSGVFTYNTFLDGRIVIRSTDFVDFKNNVFYNIGRDSYYDSDFMHEYKPEVVRNNIFVQTFNNLPNDFETTKGNILNAIQANLLLGYPSNPNNLQEDARYQLAPQLPARGAGENGTDCGAFGGDDPYVLSGIPDIPSIYQLTVPSQVPQNGTLNVQIKAKTNN